MNNNLHLSTYFLLKMAQRNITKSPSGNERFRPSENDIIPSIASDSDSTSDSELGDQNELTVSANISFQRL